jgi:hypothetical protein
MRLGFRANRVQLGAPQWMSYRGGSAHAVSLHPWAGTRIRYG